MLLLASSSKDVWTDFTVSSKYLVDNHKPDGVNVPYESENSFLSNLEVDKSAHSTEESSERQTDRWTETERQKQMQRLEVVLR